MSPLLVLILGVGIFIQILVLILGIRFFIQMSPILVLILGTRIFIQMSPILLLILGIRIFIQILVLILGTRILLKCHNIDIGIGNWTNRIYCNSFGRKLDNWSHKSLGGGRVLLSTPFK